MRTARRRGRLATRMTRALALAGLVASASLAATGSTAGVADAACTFVQDQTINNTSSPPPDPLFGNLTSNGPYGVAADGAGNVHLVDPSSNAAYRFDAGGAQTLTIAGAASPAFTDPDGVAVDSAGNIYVGSPDPSASVQKFAPDGSHVATLLGTAFPADERFRNPRGIVVDDVTGTVYFVESGGGVVRVYAADTDLANPVILIDKADPEPDFNGLGGLALDADHNVYVAGSSRNLLGDPYGIVYKFAPDGTQVIDGPWPLVDPATLTFRLWGVDVDASGNVYVVDGGIGPSTSSPDPTAAVYGFSPSGDLFLTIDNAFANAPDPAFITPRDVSVDDSGTQLHVTDIWSNTLYRFTADCGQPQDANIFVNAGEGFVQVGGFGWPGEHVTVTVDDPDTAGVELTFDPVTPENGQFGVEQHGIQASADWVVTATDGNITKTLVVVDFTIDRVDTSDGRVEGTASPGTVLELIANGPDPDAVVGVTADATGAWSTVLPLPVAGGDLSAHYIDGDGDFMGYSYRWPGISVMLSDDVEEDGTVPGILLGGSSWPPGAVVNVVVDDPADVYDREFDFDVTGWGELDHWALGETGIPNGVVGDGWSVTATATFDGWTTTKTHDVATVRVNETDHVAGTASGVCPAGRPETWVGTVSGRWPGQGGSGMQVDCADGTWAFGWEVDQFDIPLVTVGLRDGDWDGTSFLNFQDRPQVYHDAATGTVTFIYWNGGDVEVLLDGEMLTTIPHPGEQWYRTTLEQHGVQSSDITPGATITFQTPTELKAMVVEPVTIDSIDQDGSVSGTAAADAEVMVGVANADRFGGPAEFEVTMADGEGNWSAQLPPEVFPLDFDHVVRATVLDYDDDANIAEFVPAPQIVVRPTDDVVVALGFPQGEIVTVTVDDDQDPGNGVLFSIDREIHDPYHAYLELFDEESGEEWDVVAGEVVTVSSESSSATHVVTELTTSGVDTDADVVTGRAAPGSQVDVNVNDEPIWRVVTTKPDGTWIADFAVPGDPELGGGVADLQPGSEGQAKQYDEEGNATGAVWRAPNPMLEVDPFEDIVTLNEVLPGTGVEISVNGAPAGSAIAAPWGNSYWQAAAQVDLYPAVDVSAGDGVEAVASTGEVVTTVISPLTVDGSDVDVQMLTGTANPGAEVFINAGSQESDAHRRVTADGSGRWTAEFATEPEPGEEDQEPPGYGTVDLASLRWLDVGERVGNGGTTIYRRDERPSLFTFPAEGAIWSFNWYPLDPVDLTVSNDSGVVHEVSGLVPKHGPSPTTIGDVTFDLPEENPRASIVYELPAGMELRPGDRVTMSDALMTVTGEVGEITVDEAHLWDETLSGTTAADSAFVVAFDAEGHIGAVEPVDGTWTTPLCTPDPLGGCDGIDLTHGSTGVVLAFPGEESIDETGTAATWSMAPRILSIDAPATAAFMTETTVLVTVADIERPDVQSVTVDWGEKKNDNDKDTSIAWVSDPDGPTDLEFTHIYKVKGTVTVTVTMTDAGGSATTQTFPIEITKR